MIGQSKTHKHCPQVHTYRAPAKQKRTTKISPRKNNNSRAVHHPRNTNQKPTRNPPQYAATCSPSHPYLYTSSSTYAHLPPDRTRGSKNMLETKTNKLTGVKVAPLPEMSNIMINQDRKIIFLTAKKLDQWVPKLTTKSYLQDQQEK